MERPSEPVLTKVRKRKRAYSELTLKKNTEGKRVRRWEERMSASAAWDRWLEPAFAVSLAIDRQKKGLNHRCARIIGCHRVSVVKNVEGT